MYHSILHMNRNKNMWKKSKDNIVVKINMNNIYLEHSIHLKMFIKVNQ